MKQAGYFGKILAFDLTNEKYEEIKLSDDFYRQYLGGYGLGCRILSEKMGPNVDPLSPDSIFGFFPGLLTGTVAPFSGRYMVVGKSPLTGGWGDANAGGTFGPEIKKCGYDGLVFMGKASMPVYVLINDGNIEILDAKNIWGLDIIQSEIKLKEKHGDQIKTAGIGKAGEKLSRIAGIANDKGRIAARSGLGAIMGSKNLKMVALRGKEKILFYDREKFMSLVRNYNKESKTEDAKGINKWLLQTIPNMAKLFRRFRLSTGGGSPKMLRSVYHNLGTPAGNTLSAETGDSPVKNWKGIGMIEFPFDTMSRNLSATKIHQYRIRHYGCFACPVQCGAILKIPEINMEETHMPEYETCCSFGAMLLNSDLFSIFKINDLCNREGIDTISTGATVAFALECYEKGILTKEDTDGLELTWGNSEAIIKLVNKIINREGIGNILADGAKIAAEKIGKGSEKFAMTSLGQEIAMHNPRVFNSLAFSYAYDPTPGKHTTASIDFFEIGPAELFLQGLRLPKGWKKDIALKARAQRIITGVHQVVSSVGLCMFSTLMGTYPLMELINSLTGWDITLDELITTGLRIQTIRQAFTLREGVPIAKNKLPGRIIGDPPDEKGPLKGITIDNYDEFYKLYCKEMGWNPENGYPLKETLRELNLEFVIKDLY
ncbi:MAG: aldehyde ferredoxin oxidoreductase family protein [Promethearchaeota archaeon]